MAALTPYWLRSPEGVPIIGEWIANVGMAVEVWNTPCDNLGAWVVVEGFFYELPVLLWSLFKPDPLDAAYDRFAPLQPRGGHRKNKPRRRGFSFTPNGWIPGELEKIGRYWRAWFWLGNLAQRIGWYFIIADATSKFLVRWSTTSMQWAGCLEPPGWVRGIVKEAVPPFGFSGTENTVPFTATSNMWSGERIIASIHQDAFEDMHLETEVLFGRQGLLPMTGTLTCVLQTVESFETHLVCEGRLESGGANISGHLRHRSRAKNFGRTWQVKVYTQPEGIGQGFGISKTSTFKGQTHTPTILSDPP